MSFHRMDLPLMDTPALTSVSHVLPSPSTVLVGAVVEVVWVGGGVTTTVVDEEEPDEYVQGSFVVDDDAEISFEAGPSSDDF